ncbi:MAG: substrate-binding domain-containing protein [Kiritimatiellae bacterium]|nr:substrate-binding domain-containing protein [Kiritimatiellia bacterium]
MATQAKTVLVVVPKLDEKSHAEADMIRRIGAARRWNVFLAECHRADDGSLVIDRAPFPVESPEALIETIRPDGIVILSDTISFGEARQLAGKGIPILFPGRTPDPGSAVAAPAGFVFADQNDIAKRAARVLLSSGYDDFGFVPFLPKGTVWSPQRGEAFRNYIHEAGKTFHAFPRIDSSHSRIEALGRWLEKLPKPCGLFAANDLVGERVVRTCLKIGLRVPDDIAVIGVDNLEHICEATTPAISSVAKDSLAEGSEVVALLSHLMARRTRKALASRAVPVRGVVLRASSRFARDRRVARAQEFVRLNACREGFGPPEVVKAMGLSRTQADVVFRAATGHTILDEIHAVRLAHAKELLSQGRRADFVAAACGYASGDDFRRDFRNRLGTTPRKWALEHLT